MNVMRVKEQLLQEIINYIVIKYNLYIIYTNWSDNGDIIISIPLVSCIKSK